MCRPQPAYSDVQSGVSNKKVTCSALGDARPRRRNKMLGSSKNRSNSQTDPPVLNSTANKS